jgi:predicted NBD/HSP70 family sugar kinase
VAFVQPGIGSVILKPMYLAVDIGGSKTLLAVFSEDGQKVSQVKTKTPQNYRKFLAEIKTLAKPLLEEYEISDCCCAVPGLLDRQKGVAIRFGNLTWENVPIKKDIGALLGGIPVLIENDANLGGLSEATLVHEKYKRVAYITLSRGIGGKILINGKIDPDFADAEVGFMVLNYQGELTEWEEFASGDALFKKTGLLASQVNDPAIWKDYAYGVAMGLQPLLVLWEPDVVIIGGGVGAHFEKFEPYLKEGLSKFNSHMVNIPTIIKARRPEEAVIYGCYEFIQQNS